MDSYSGILSYFLDYGNATVVPINTNGIFYISIEENPASHFFESKYSPQDNDLIYSSFSSSFRLFQESIENFSEKLNWFIFLLKHYREIPRPEIYLTIGDFKYYLGGSFDYRMNIDFPVDFISINIIFQRLKHFYNNDKIIFKHMLLQDLGCHYKSQDILACLLFVGVPFSQAIYVLNDDLLKNLQCRINSPFGSLGFNKYLDTILEDKSKKRLHSKVKFLKDACLMKIYLKEFYDFLQVKYYNLDFSSIKKVLYTKYLIEKFGGIDIDSNGFDL